MKKKKSIKHCLLMLASILCVAFLGIFLTVMQTRLAVGSQRENTEKNVSQIQDLVDGAYETAQQNEETYDEIYVSKAETVAYMAKKDTSFTYTNAFLRQLASRLNVTNILILDKEGKVISQAQTSPAEFSRNRFNQLRTVFSNAEPSEPFEVEWKDQVYRYYGARIDNDYQVVIEHDPEELHQIQSDINSWESMLANVKVGLTGYTFAVSSKDYTILYHPDENLVGMDSINAGLDVVGLKDNNYTWMNLNGERLYCGVANIDNHNAYVICAVPESEMVASRSITVGVVLFIFLTVIAVIMAYAFFVLKEQASDEEEWEYVSLPGGFQFNKNLGRRLGTLSIVGLVVVFAVSFYMQTLFALSMRSISNSRQMGDLETTLARNEEDVELLTAQFTRRNLNKCQIAADILKNNPQLHTREDLLELADILDVELIYIFDKEGKEEVSNSHQVGFQISQNPEDQSYAFNKLINGSVENVVQEPMNDESSGQYRQYIGSIIYDEDELPNGFVQIAIYPEKLEKTLEATELSNVLEGVKASAGGFAFAVEKDTKNFLWFPQARMIGKSAINYGMKEYEFQDGYTDHIKLGNAVYYAYGIERENDYLYIVTPKSQINKTRLPVALVSAAMSLLFLGVLFLFLTITREKPAEEELASTAEGPMIDVKMPDGSVRKTDSAASRWTNTTIKWGDRTAEQQVAAILKGLMSVFAIMICASVLLKDRFFGENSIFLYIINGRWHRGLNVFALTGCIMLICVFSVALMFVREILRMLSKTFGARGETICRMLRSFVKYFAYIAMLYYCFAMFGVDTKTLLASAGVLSLVIGLGAKELVSDILAGIFIIFEGEFRVGDIVTIGDWRGTVQEIGVRTTKIMDPGQNVKIISNSSVSGVINMTRRNSYTSCDIGIEYGESLERVENILAKELPQIKKRLPAIKDGPFYKGVVSLGDNSVNIRIIAQCAEGDRAQLGRDLNREMKLLFDKHDINIPFPQVVINNPREYQKATELEKRRADAFNEAQKELSKQMKEDGEKS